MSDPVTKAIFAGFSAGCQDRGYRRKTRQVFLKENESSALTREISLFLSPQAEDIEFNVTFRVRSLKWELIQGLAHAETGFARDLVQVSALTLRHPDEAGVTSTAFAVAKGSDPDRVKDEVREIVRSGESQVLEAVTSLDALANLLLHGNRRYIMLNEPLLSQEVRIYQEWASRAVRS